MNDDRDGEGMVERQRETINITQPVPGGSQSTSPAAQRPPSALPFSRERRRSVRRRLREPSDVTLQSTGCDLPWSCRGSLLNLSTHGMAVRLDVEDATLLRAGQTVRLGFRLADCADSFHFFSHVITVTQGASPQRYIVGLEFIPDTEYHANQATLREALQEP